MQPRAFVLGMSGCFLVLAATAAYNVFAMQYRFGGYDLSPLIDSGWRVLQGQIPNRDFICVFPPSLYLWVEGAFRLGGVRWEVLSASSSVFFLLVTMLGLRLCSLLAAVVGREPALIVGAVFTAAQMIPLLVVGHPWHSAMGQSLACYALLATFCLVRLDRGKGEHRGEFLGHLSLAMGALLLSKPNLAGPTIVVCLASMLVSGARRWALLPLGCGSLLATIALLTVKTNLLALMRVYGGLRGRFFANYLFLDILDKPSIEGGLAWLLMFLPVAPLLYLFARTTWKRRWKVVTDSGMILALGGLGVTLIGLSTDAELRIVETPAVLVGAALLLLARPEEQPRIAPALLRGTMSLLVVAVFLSATRARMQMVGSWAEDSCGPRTLLHDRFFGEFYSCPLFGQVLAESDAAVATHPGRTFFGPRIEFLYARDGLQSPLHLPMWWHPGTSYALELEPSIDAAWKADDFDLLVFGKNDRIRIPQAILDEMSRSYMQLPGTTATDVFVRRTR